MSIESNPLLNYLGLSEEDLNEEVFDPHFDEARVLQRLLQYLSQKERGVVQNV